MSAAGKFPVTLVLCGAAALYLTGDLFVFHGPAHRGILSLFPAEKTDPAVAGVDGQSITRSQLERATAARVWFEGKSPASLTKEELSTARSAALDGLIEHELLRIRIMAAKDAPLPSDSEIEQRLKIFTARFDSKSALDSALKSQGIRSGDELKQRLAAQLQQEKFIEAEIATKIRVTDDEARKWFSENEKTLSNPERVEARHVFIATLDHPPEEAKQKLDEALAALTEKKKDFATLARELSEDAANKDSGGSLGWMTRDRLPVDFATPLFSLEIGKPTLIRSRLGWHLAEVTARKPAEPRTFEQAKPEIVAALESVKRRKAVADFRAELRKSAADRIRIF